MSNNPNDRRQFLKAMSVGVAGAAVAALPNMSLAAPVPSTGAVLQVWPCRNTWIALWRWG